MATTSFSTWDFANNRIVAEAKGGQFVSAETTLIAAGAPSLTDTTYAASGNLDNTVYPIGLLESFGLQQNKQLQRIFEIGSSRSYFVPGRVIGSVSLGRTFYYGPSLMRVMYAYYNSLHVGETEPGSTIEKTLPDGTKTTAPDPKAALGLGGKASFIFKRNPGYDYFFIDLASDLFSQPTGLAVYFKDYASQTVGAFYLEETYIQGHQMNVSSGSVLVMEGAQAQYDILTPIKMMV